MVLNEEEGLECEVHINEICCKYVSGFKYFGFTVDESGTDGAECIRKLVSGRSVAGAIRSLVNARNFYLEYARVLH